MVDQLNKPLRLYSKMRASYVPHPGHEEKPWGIRSQSPNYGNLESNDRSFFR